MLRKTIWAWGFWLIFLYPPPRLCTLYNPIHDVYQTMGFSWVDFSFPIITGINKLYQIKGFLYHLSAFTFLNLYPTQQYKRCVHFWNNFPCITSLPPPIYASVHTKPKKYLESKQSKFAGLKRKRKWGPSKK